MEVFLHAHAYSIIFLGDDHEKYLTLEPCLLVRGISMLEVCSLLLLLLLEPELERKYCAYEEVEDFLTVAMASARGMVG